MTYLTAWYHWKGFTLLDYLFIKVTDQKRKPVLWVQALNQARNAALQLLLTQQEIHRSLPLHKPMCQERTIVNSGFASRNLCWFQQLLQFCLPLQSSTVRIMHCAVRLQLRNPWLACLHYDLFTVFCLCTLDFQVSGTIKETCFSWQL